MELIEALQKQIEFCKNENNYMCGIYVNSEEDKNSVVKMISLLLQYDTKIKIRNNAYESSVEFGNSGFFKIIKVNKYVRGYRFNGMVIDSQISKEIVNTIVLPHLMPLRTENNLYDTNDKPMDRVYYCTIEESDFVSFWKTTYQKIVYENEMRKRIKSWTINKRLSKSWYAKLRIVDGGNSSMEDLIYYDHPVVEKDSNGHKVLLYEAWGIPKCLIEYSTEFINKTKETYLNIVGKFENESIGFENDINVHLKIDTNVYDGYEVCIEDGLVSVYLHEIKNEAPVLKDYGVA